MIFCAKFLSINEYNMAEYVDQIFTEMSDI